MAEAASGEANDTGAALQRLAGLWRRERSAAQARFAAERRETPFRERLKRGVALRDLETGDVDAAPGGRTLVWLAPRRPGGLKELRLGTGQPVRLWREDPDGPGGLRGVLARKRAQRIGVMVSGELPADLDDAPWQLDQDDDQATFERGARALEDCRQAEAESPLGRIRDVLWGARKAEFRPLEPLEPCDPELNPPQLEAVRLALAARDVALIHGPPGTGKTRTLVEVVRQAVARDERVLVAAASNTAVDNLAERLVAMGEEVVRLGHPARVSEAMEDQTLDAHLERSEGYALAQGWMRQADKVRQRAFRWTRAKPSAEERAARREAAQEFRELMRDARRQLGREQKRIVAGARVVCATAAGADTSILGPEQRFDLVVLDEATQASDPLALVALSRGDRAVLAGDPCQLPPTVLDQRASQEGLGETCFERLAGHDREAVRMLRVQHRMHERLMAYPSQSMYEGLLEAAPHVAQHRLEDLGVAADELRPGPLVFLDTAGKGWHEERGAGDPSTKNPEQAARVVAEVRRLLSRGLSPRDLAVIAAYDAQVRLLRERLAGERDQGLEVGTVDGFQGREKEAVVVDLVRSNDEGKLGFLTEIRRLNVAITRARRFLLVVGDSATVGEHPYHAGFLGEAERQEAYLSAWSDEAGPITR